MPLGSVSSPKGENNLTDEDEGRVQVLVVLFCIIAVELCRFSTICGEEVRSGIVGPERFGELFENGMEAGLDVSDGLVSQ